MGSVMTQRFSLMLVVLLLLQSAMVLAPTPSFAQATPPAGATPAADADKKSDVCTNFQEHKDKLFNGAAAGSPDDGKKGLLTEIYTYIKDIVNDSTKKLFDAFVGNEAYKRAVYAAMTLMVVFFGVGFTIGVVQPSFGQALIRLIKFAIIAALISPGGWEFFSDPQNGAGVVAFFNDGTDELIKGVMQIGVGGTPPPADASPFYHFDKLAEFLIQPDTIIAIMGSLFAGGPFGLAMGGLMIFAIGGFIKLLIQALKIYAVSFVARSLLLGLAPIFFVFLLFDRTKQLFMTWINALLSLSLQPILLFTFLSFFMILIESASKDMLGTELCWTPYKNADGSQNTLAFWRFTNPDGTPIRSEMTWKGSFECIISGKGECPEFPMNIIDVLTFLILVYLAGRFAGVIERIAYELSNAFISLDAGGRFDQFMRESGGAALNPFSGSRGPNPSASAGRAPAAAPPASSAPAGSDQQATRRPPAPGA